METYGERIRKLRMDLGMSQTDLAKALGYSEKLGIAPFKNILNDIYAKDLTRKVKIAKRSRAMDGLFIAAQVPYGYKKDPLNKNHLIVDENIRPIIKKIFTLVLNGNVIYINCENKLKGGQIDHL